MPLKLSQHWRGSPWACPPGPLTLMEVSLLCFLPTIPSRRADLHLSSVEKLAYIPKLTFLDTMWQSYPGIKRSSDSQSHISLKLVNLELFSHVCGPLDIASCSVESPFHNAATVQNSHAYFFIIQGSASVHTDIPLARQFPKYSSQYNCDSL